jgi:VIT1/CCC1 family predicted Fe2+/Mn2+ transporter
MSMAAGEYVSVSSQADTERADLARETRELETDIEGERKELADIYVGRGLDRKLAVEVADQLMAHGALAAHARDELGISEVGSARPVQAGASAASAVACGRCWPRCLAMTAIALGGRHDSRGPCLPAIGMDGGAGRGAPVTFWASLASTAGVGALVGRHLRAGHRPVQRPRPATSSATPWRWAGPWVRSSSTNSR